MNLPVDILRIHPEAQIPEYKTDGSCAFDLTLIEDAVIQPNEIARLRTGLVMCVPEDYVFICAARSSTPKRYGLCVPQGVGIVDNDYCGPTDELLIQVLNFTDKPVEVKKGDRLVQGLIIPFARANFSLVEKLAEKNRGGFGSTG